MKISAKSVFPAIDPALKTLFNIIGLQRKRSNLVRIFDLLYLEKEAIEFFEFLFEVFKLRVALVK